MRKLKGLETRKMKDSLTSMLTSILICSIIQAWLCLEGSYGLETRPYYWGKCAHICGKCDWVIGADNQILGVGRATNA